MQRQDDRMERGIDVFSSQLGIPRDEVWPSFSGRFGERFAIEAVHSAAGAWLENCLDLRERSLIVVAVLIAQGGVEERLRGHVRWALTHGASREQLEEMVTLLAPYVGYPKASVGMEILRAELDAAEMERED